MAGAGGRLSTGLLTSYFEDRVQTILSVRAIYLTHGEGQLLTQLLGHISRRHVGRAVGVLGVRVQLGKQRVVGGGTKLGSQFVYLLANRSAVFDRSRNRNRYILHATTGFY